MGLSNDPEKRAKQLANLAKSNAKLAARLAAGDSPEPPARTPERSGPGRSQPGKRSDVVRDRPPRSRKRTQRTSDDERRERRERRDDDAPRSGGGFFSGLFDV